MARLIIDRQEIDVPEGTKIIDAAEKLGITIPHFCYHPALGSLGACRLCAVKFLEGPVKGLDMSCMIEAEEGMVISTTDAEAVAFRKFVIECLMLNHPHDCPVCDEGGECLLQDETVSGGHGIRRYLGKKRTFEDNYLGPFVQQEMNRCIHCFRCRRFYQDFSGYRDLGALQIGSRTYFGPFSNGVLESPFTGNLIDICPTGVYTDKPARFKARRWDLQQGPSVCVHCSLGCNTTAGARYRAMVRQEARINPKVNGHFICDRGRFGFEYANLPQRPRRASVFGKGVPWEEAIQSAAFELTQVAQKAGPGAIASLGSPRNSLETQATLKKICRQLGWLDPRFFLDPVTERKVGNAVSRLDSRLAISMAEIEEADMLLLVGADPINEAPMLAMALRQASRKGAIITALDPRPLSLPFAFDHVAVAPGEIDLCLGVLIKAALSVSEVKSLDAKAREFYDALPGDYPQDPSFQDRLLALGHALGQAKRPVLICGTGIVREKTPAFAADLVLLLKYVASGAALFYLLPGANAFGAGLLSSGDGSGYSLLEAMEKGTIKALLLVESDPLGSFPDRDRLMKAMEKVDLIVVLDYLPSADALGDHIILPTATVFEGAPSSFINQEGRVQVATPPHIGGVPISQVSRDVHPPRRFQNTIPGDEPKTAMEVLEEITAVISGDNGPLSSEDLWTWMSGENPVFGRMHPSEGAVDGRRLVAPSRQERDFTAFGSWVSSSEGQSGDFLEILVVDWTFGTEELSAYSASIQQVESPPRGILHRRDADRLGLGERGRIRLSFSGGPLEIKFRVTENMAQGVIIIPAHRQLNWQRIREWPAMIAAKRIGRI